jgi:sucrose phosphorylase
LNEFWNGKGKQNEEGIIIPESKYLDKLFMRKSLASFKVCFPDELNSRIGIPYQQITYNPIT